MKLLVSLHDVTPFHLPRLRRAEALFEELGLRKLTYLLIPDYHGKGSCAEHPEFLEWTRRARPFAVDWHLHGYHHKETPEAGASADNTWSAVFKRRFLTGGEGEFLALDEAAQRRKLEAGREVFRRCLGRDPEGFVAPAWLFNPALPPLLGSLGFRYTEDHFRLYRVDTGSALASPVVTWATRTLLKKYGSLLACPALARLWRSKPVVRLAAHPFDFEHPETVASLRRVLTRLAAEREQCAYGDLEFTPAR